MKHSALTRAMSLLGTCFALCASAQAGTFSVTNTSATGTG